MCDLNRVSGYLIAANAAYLATLVLLGVGILNSLSLFAAAANVALMVAAIACTAAASILYGLALLELDACAAEACATELAGLRAPVIVLITSMAVYAAGLIALAVVAAIPIAGAAAIGNYIVLGINLTGLVAAAAGAIFTNAVNTYNDCRTRAGVTTIHILVLIAFFVVGVVGTVLNLLTAYFSVTALMKLAAAARR